MHRAETASRTGKKTPGGAETHTGHTRDTRAHTGTRITQTNLTTIQTHQHTTRTTARRPKPRPTQQPQPRSRPLPAADSEEAATAKPTRTCIKHRLCGPMFGVSIKKRPFRRSWVTRRGDRECELLLPWLLRTAVLLALLVYCRGKRCIAGLAPRSIDIFSSPTLRRLTACVTHVSVSTGCVGHTSVLAIKALV
jgi:hypothetical protein